MAETPDPSANAETNSSPPIGARRGGRCRVESSSSESSESSESDSGTSESGSSSSEDDVDADYEIFIAEAYPIRGCFVRTMKKSFGRQFEKLGFSLPSIRYFADLVR